MGTTPSEKPSETPRKTPSETQKWFVQFDLRPDGIVATRPCYVHSSRSWEEAFEITAKPGSIVKYPRRFMVYPSLEALLRTNLIDSLAFPEYCFVVWEVEAEFKPGCPTHPDDHIASTLKLIRPFSGKSKNGVGFKDGLVVSKDDRVLVVYDEKFDDGRLNPWGKRLVQKGLKRWSYYVNLCLTQISFYDFRKAQLKKCLSVPEDLYPYLPWSGIRFSPDGKVEWLEFKGAKRRVDGILEAYFDKEGNVTKITALDETSTSTHATISDIVGKTHATDPHKVMIGVVKENLW